MMNILLAGNDIVYPGLELVIYSTMNHNKNINWFIFTMDITIINDDTNEAKAFTGLGKWERNRLRMIVKSFDSHSNITFIDTHDLYMQEFWKNPNEFNWLTPYAPLRLLADIALPEVDRLLYLDADTAVDGDLRPMYESYLDENTNYAAYECKAVINTDISEMISGVMLLNLKKIRETGFLEQARKNVRTHIYKWYDQDAIVAVGRPEKVLPEKYSYMYEYEYLTYKPVIYHFTNDLNPKIYQLPEGRDFFYKRYPFLNYVKEGVERLGTSNFNCGYTYETEPPLVKPHIKKKEKKDAKQE